MFKVYIIDKILTILSSVLIIYGVGALYSYEAIGLFSVYQILAIWLYNFTFNNEGQIYNLFKQNGIHIFRQIITLKVAAIILYLAFLILYFVMSNLIVELDLLLLTLGVQIIRLLNIWDPIVRSVDKNNYHKIVVAIKIFSLIIALIIIYLKSKYFIYVFLILSLLELAVSVKYFKTFINVNNSNKDLDFKNILKIYFNNTASQIVSLVFITGDLLIAGAYIKGPELASYSLIRQIAFLSHFIGSVHLIIMQKYYSNKINKVEMKSYIASTIIGIPIFCITLLVQMGLIIYMNLEVNYIWAALCFALCVFPAAISQINNQILYKYNLYKHELFKTLSAALIFLLFSIFVHAIEGEYLIIYLSFSVAISFVYSNYIYFYLIKKISKNYFFMSGALRLLINNHKFVILETRKWIK
jgi:hypothetical protein